ncbi:MAG: SusD/RagB family nutrient-binding outer membrane lipoprotein [Draconibacterium sp.]
MKKILIIILSAFMLFSSCQDRLEEEFKNPMVYSPDLENLAPGLYTSMLTQWKFYIKDYGEWWWQNGGTGIFTYAQIANRYITSRYGWYIDYDDLAYQEPDAGFGWFDDYYVRMRNWGALRDIMIDMEGTDQYNDNLIYYQLGTVIKDWGALRNVDIYNSIPYFDAFKGTEGVFFVEYDDPIEIYKAILEELKTIADELPGAYNAMSPAAKALLAEQDLAFGGDVDKWVEYISALRLRYGIRLAGVDETAGKTHISEAIDNLPTEDLYWEILQVDAVADLPGGGTWQRGMYERAYAMHVPNIILNRMNFHDPAYEEGVDDPRLPVLAYPTKYNDYRGVSYNSDAQDDGYNSGDRYYPYADNLVASTEQNAKSMWSHTTYTYNNQPADMFTLGEIDLLLAEVAMKGYASTGKTAGEHMKDAVVHSTNWWYMINSLSSYGSELPADNAWKSLIMPTKPAEGVISSYGDKVKTAFEAADDNMKMEILMQQKYIHINLLRPYLLWSELKRTRHPKLEPMTFNGKVMKPELERIRYPSSEFQNNNENYQKVIEFDNYSSKSDLIPSSLKSTSMYRDTDIDFKTSETPDFN